MTVLPAGARISLAYECRDEEGTMLERIPVDSPAEFAVGSGDLLPALETVLAGMRAGESRRLVLAPEEAFGLRDEELVGFVPFEQLPDDPPPALGDTLELVPEGEDEAMPAMVVAVEEDGCLLDANHPLAGKTLHFDLRLVAILD